MERGICKLCLLEKDLCDSHLLPRACYDYCRPEGADPIFATSKIVLQSSRQMQWPLLCKRCETVLNEGGEDWMVPLFVRYDGGFPFHDFFKNIAPSQTYQGYDGYAAGRTAIDIKKVTHFALGIYWKSSVHSWRKDSQTPIISFGRYGEGIRRYLLGEADFPERIALVVGVMRPPVKEIAFLVPYQGSAREYHNFMFYTSGIWWGLLVGKGVNEEQRLTCFASSVAHPVLVGDFSQEVRQLFHDTIRGAKKARNIEKYLKR